MSRESLAMAGGAPEHAALSSIAVRFTVDELYRAAGMR